jgi:NAD-dependent SIR2 family protein deacetylase
MSAAHLGMTPSSQARTNMRLWQIGRYRTSKPSHVAIHKRIYTMRGKARAQSCVDCGKSAAEWSHRHDTDPLDVENYDPRCHGCHKRYDHIVANLGQYARAGHA